MNREERRIAAREGILAAAHRQLAECGHASASVGAVAARAGLASGSLYRHFPSRAALLAEVVGDALRGEHALLIAAAGGGVPPYDGLIAWVRLSTERALQAPGLFHALLAEPADAAVDAVRVSRRRAQNATLAALLEAGADAGAWPARDTAAQAAAITGALQASLVGPLARERVGEQPDVPREAAALTTFVLGAVGARDATRTPPCA